MERPKAAERRLSASAKLTGGDFETKLAAAFKIADDEDGHVDHAADDLKNIIKTESDFLAAKMRSRKFPCNACTCGTRCFPT